MNFFRDFPIDNIAQVVYNKGGSQMQTTGGDEVTIGEKLRKLRGKKKKQIIADAIGVSYSSYVKYERDERHPSDEVKKRIAKYFGVTVQSIFFS